MFNLYAQEFKRAAGPWDAGNILGEIDMQVPTQAKERHGGKGRGRSKLRTRRYEDAVANVAEECDLIKPAGIFGLRLLFQEKTRRGDLSNLLKSVEDALNRVAYEDDSGIDYLQVIREVVPTAPATIVQVIERQS